MGRARWRAQSTPAAAVHGSACGPAPARDRAPRETHASCTVNYSEGLLCSERTSRGPAGCGLNVRAEIPHQHLPG